MELLTIIIAFLLVLVVYKLSKGRINTFLEKLPGPQTVPVLGNILELMVPREKLMKVIMTWDEKYGKIYRSWIGPMLPTVHLSKAEYVEIILSSNKHIKKGHIYDFLHPWLGTGLLTSTGMKWFKHRKMITPTFHFQVLDNFVEIFNENAEKIIKLLNKKVQTDNVLDIYPFITLCALDIICESSMGAKINAQEQQHSEYVMSLYKLIALTIKRVTGLLGQADVLFYMTPSGKTYRRVLETIHNFTKNVITERRKTRPTGEIDSTTCDELGRKKKKAFLDLLLDVADKESVQLTDEQIREEVDTFMFEGHDTTTASICWTLLLLGHHQDIQQQAYEEQMAIFHDDPNRPITMKDVQEMKLLDRILKESLRLYPSVPYISRELEEDVNIGEYTIPAGVSVVLHIFTLHRDPKVFPQPETFNPDNFLPERTQNRHPYAYIPFSAGPRNCIGQKFALLEEKIILSSLLRSFKFESLEKREDLTLIFELVLRTASGIKLRMSPRVH